MKIDSIQPTLNLQAFFEFAKLGLAKQSQLLEEKGLFLDLDSDKLTLTRLYFISGFFVEVVSCRRKHSVTEIIPYKQGYRIENYLEVRLFSAGRNSLCGKGTLN